MNPEHRQAIKDKITALFNKEGNPEDGAELFTMFYEQQRDMNETLNVIMEQLKRLREIEERRQAGVY